MLHYSTLDTPTGPFTLLVSDAGAVRAAGFTADVGELLPLIHPDLVEETRPAADVGPAGGARRGGGGAAHRRSLSRPGVGRDADHQARYTGDLHGVRRTGRAAGGDTC